MSIFFYIYSLLLHQEFVRDCGKTKKIKKMLPLESVSDAKAVSQRSAPVTQCLSGYHGNRTKIDTLTRAFSLYLWYFHLIFYISIMTNVILSY